MTNKVNPGEKVASVGEMEEKHMRALLATLAEDEHALIHKLEIRLKQGGIYRVIARVTKKDDSKQKV
jgi:hypothetical protein